MNLIYNLMPLFAGIFWGATGPFVRTLEAAGWGSITIVYSRMLAACILLFLCMLLLRRDLLRIRLKDLWIFILGGAVFTLGLNVCYQETISNLTLSLAAVLLGMSPVFVLILSRILFGEKITRVKVFSMFLAIFGCALVSGVLEPGGTGGKVSALSILIGIASAACYGMQSIMMRTAANHGYHPVTTTFYFLLTVGIAAIPFTDHSAILHYTAAAPLAHGGFLLLSGLICSILPCLLYNASLAKVETGRASILAAAGEPSAATVFGMLIYHEEPTVFTITGLVVVIIALAIICRPAKEH